MSYLVLAMNPIARLLHQLDLAKDNSVYLERETPWDNKAFEANNELIRSLRNAILAIDPSAIEIL